ncbi:MAG TPA: L-threonylcarbamoyladenylate synthase [bacterium]|nr:L-threonylcarbamoyladenylate synthase [bacterium]
MERKTTLIIKAGQWPDESDKFAEKVQTGGIIIFPTETVYGIGAMPEQTGVEKLTELKARPQTKPLQLLISDREMLEKFGAKISPLANKIMDKLWPGPLTLVLDVEGAEIPDAIGKFGNIGFRMPDHPVCLDMIRRCGGAIAASSANPSNQQPTRSCSEALRMFPGRIDAAIDAGTLPEALASTVASVRNGNIIIIRKGAVNADRLIELKG